MAHTIVFVAIWIALAAPTVLLVVKGIDLAWDRYVVPRTIALIARKCGTDEATVRAAWDQAAEET